VTIVMIAESMTGFHRVGDPATVWGGGSVCYMPDNASVGLVG
jgi:hypothetical protein